MQLRADAFHYFAVMKVSRLLCSVFFEKRQVVGLQCRDHSTSRAHGSPQSKETEGFNLIPTW